MCKENGNLIPMTHPLALIDFLKLIRWKNILIYWFTTGLIYYKFHKPTGDNNIFFYSILFFTMLGIAGNLHNNYTDYDLDKLKTEFVDFDKKLIKKIFLALYFLDFILIFFITPFSQGLFFTIIFLILYNILLKKIAFIGNFTIALITATSILIPFISQSNFKNNLWIFLSLMIIIITLMRELLKDFEDKEPDKKFKYKTLPVISFKLSYVTLLIYFIFFYWVLIKYKSLFDIRAYQIFFIFSVLIFIGTTLNLFRNNWEKTTQYIKILMLAGIIYFVYGNNIG